MLLHCTSGEGGACLCHLCGHDGPKRSPHSAEAKGMVHTVPWVIPIGGHGLYSRCCLPLYREETQADFSHPSQLIFLHIVIYLKRMRLGRPLLLFGQEFCSSSCSHQHGHPDLHTASLASPFPLAPFLLGLGMWMEKGPHLKPGRLRGGLHGGPCEPRDQN